MTTDLRPCLACGASCTPANGDIRRVQIAAHGVIVVPWRYYFFCGECLPFVDALSGELDEDVPPFVDEVTDAESSR